MTARERVAQPDQIRQIGQLQSIAVPNILTGCGHSALRVEAKEPDPKLAIIKL